MTLAHSTIRPIIAQLGGVAALVCLFGACAPTARPNIVLIVIDTLRADRVGWYGANRGVTPFLDSLASRGSVFWSAYAQCSWTSPSVASLLTSRYPSQHGVMTWASVLSVAEITLAEVLKKEGYATGAFVANPLLKPSLGYDQGFDHYELSYTGDPDKAPNFWLKGRADRVNRDALAWIDAFRVDGHPPSRLFLYLHYMEPHPPYAPPKDLLDQVLSRRGHQERMPKPYWDHADPETLKIIEDLYDAEVASVDLQLAKLFEALEARHLLADSLVVITADHGEELMDHRYIGHGKTLYNEAIHVPLLLLRSGHTQREDVRDVVSLVDIAPTLLELAGISVPSTFEGQPLTPLMRRPGYLSQLWADLPGLKRSRRPPSAYIQLPEDPKHIPVPRRRHTEAIVAGSRKLIARPIGYEGYDLRTDPSEQNPNGLRESDRRVLMQALEEANRRLQRDMRRERIDAIDEHTKEQMRALGYDD